MTDFIYILLKINILVWLVAILKSGATIGFIETFNRLWNQKN